MPFRVVLTRLLWYNERKFKAEEVYRWKMCVFRTLYTLGRNTDWEISM